MALERLIKALNAGEKMRATSVPDIKIASSVDIVRQTKTGRNVLARLVSKSKVKRAPVVIGAHVDHLGKGNVSVSLATGR